MSAAPPQLRVLQGPKHGAVAEHHQTEYQINNVLIKYIADSVITLP